MEQGPSAHFRTDSPNWSHEFSFNDSRNKYSGMHQGLHNIVDQSSKSFHNIVDQSSERFHNTVDQFSESFPIFPKQNNTDLQSKKYVFQLA